MLSVAARNLSVRPVMATGARALSSAGASMSSGAMEQRVHVDREESAARPQARTRVIKFGGSSVGNADAIKNVASYIADEQRQGEKIVAVSSALFGATNRLVSAVEAAERGDASTVHRERDLLVTHHEEVSSQLLKEFPSLREEWVETMRGLFTDDFDGRLDAVLERGHTVGNDADLVCSLGERLSTSLLAARLGVEGCPSEFIPSDAIIRTDGVPGNSQVLLEETEVLVRAVLPGLLDQGVVPCVTGFFGASAGGMLTVLGRGGSDLTAAVLGASLDADEVALSKVESTKDNNGFLASWEPGWEGVVHDAVPTATIKDLSYEAAGQLSHFGKSVLHPATVYPCLGKGIPVRVVNTLDPHHPGTAIVPSQAVDRDEAMDHPILAITKAHLTEYEGMHGREIDLQPAHDVPSSLDLSSNLRKEDISLLVMAGTNVEDHRGEILARVGTALDEAGISWALPHHINGSPDHLSVAVERADVKPALAAVHADLFPAVPLP